VSPAEFKAEYMARWYEPPGYQKAVALWCWYYVTTEAFDRTVCSGARLENGRAVPVDRWETSTIEHYASLCNRAMRTQAFGHRLDAEAMKAAQKTADEIQDKEQRDIVRRAALEWPDLFPALPVTPREAEIITEHVPTPAIISWWKKGTTNT
jgi:hypothetical protein